ncbi:MAG: FliH/SctL family protein [Syntrophaceae bacterium]
MSDRVIKSENVELVKAGEDKSQVFKRFYSQKKRDAGGSGADTGKIGNNSNDTLIALKIEKAEKEAYTKGYADGIREGAEREKRKLFQAIDALANSMRELDRIKRDTLEGNDEKILNLVFSVSEKIINQEITINRDVVYGVLKNAIKQILDKEGIKVRLNPEDYRTVMEMKPGIINGFEDIKDMTIVDDGSISRGGVIIETSSGEVDARIDQQLYEVRKAVSGKH